jgi:hypothetical protein
MYLLWQARRYLLASLNPNIRKGNYGMNMPGFRAASSLYRTSERYRASAAGISTQAGQVLPQQGVDLPYIPYDYVRRFWCYRAYRRCESRCDGRPNPFDEVCRVGCSIQLNSCLSG